MMFALANARAAFSAFPPHKQNKKGEGLIDLRAIGQKLLYCPEMVKPASRKVKMFPLPEHLSVTCHLAVEKHSFHQRHIEHSIYAKPST